MYSQRDEETHIVPALAGPPGRFLDIGAYNGKKFSNTLRLVELGWGGVCLEPDPIVFPKLAELHKDRPDIVCLQLALTPASGPVTFWSAGGDAVATTVPAHRDKWARGSKSQFTQMTVQGISVADLLARYPGPYRFVNLDVEGANWELLQTLPLDVMATELICVEKDDHRDDMLAWLKRFGLRQLIYESGENLVVRCG